MLAPPKPIDEPDRVNALRSLQILDTPPEERFDRVTRIARRLFGVPIALVSLVDTNRQWFKSAQGLDAAETPREISFCGHAILGDDILVVRDALLDERFHDNPLVTGEPRIRFYAGCPLRIDGGKRLGTLCLIDREPRQFGADDLEALRDLALTVERELAVMKLASLDELTQLANRRGFDSLSRLALGWCRRTRALASLVYLDLDGFKAINDRYGHAEGDRALVEFGALLKRAFRESDVVGRIGGDEFAVLVTGLGTHGVDHVVGRLTRAIEASNREGRRGYDLRFSAGTVSFRPERHAGALELMVEADALMYARKRARGGKEAVVQAPGLSRLQAA